MATNISARMDYYRSIYHDQATAIQLASGLFAPDTVEYHPPLYGYRNGLRNVENGAVLLTNPHDAQMGNCVQIGGAALLAIETITELPSWRALQDNGLREARATRIDIAIDLFDGNLTGTKVLAALEQGIAKTKFRKWQQVKGGGADNGYTLYLGGRESATQIRIYDKGAEQGLPLNWWRFEMVLNGIKAQDAWRTIRDIPDAPALLPIAKAMLASMLEFPTWGAWNAVFGDYGEVNWTEIPRAEADSWAWLMTQVAPTFQRKRERDGDWRYLEQFVEAVKNALQHG